MNYFFEQSEEAVRTATTVHGQWMQTEEFKRRDAEWTKRIAELTAKRDAGELYSTAKKDFTFTLSCSEQPYADKNSIFWSAVHYKRVNLTLNQFEKIIQRGFCFTSIFKQESFLVKDKTEANWIGSQFVVFDIDNVRQEVNLCQFISALSMKPTFAYTTPNHAVKKPKENKAYSRFRLVYVFDSTIEAKTQYQAIYDSIERDFPLDYFDNTKRKDNCGSSPVQQFSGNALPTCELIINKENIYSVSSFPTEPQTPPERPTEPSKPTEPKQPSKKPSKPTEPLFRLNETFFRDSNSMPPVNFIRKYINAYGIIEKPDIIFENGFYETTEDYVEIVRKFRKVYDDKTQNYKTKRLRIPSGERHTTLFAYAKLRCQIKPEISNEELFPDFVTLKILIFYLLDTELFVSLCHPNLGDTE